MVKRKPIAALLIVLGPIWLIAASWIHLTMTAITEPVLPFPAYLALAFGPPLLLIISAVVLFERASCIATSCCLAACALLIWWLGPAWFDMVLDFFRSPQPLRPSRDVADYIFSAVMAVFTLCTALAAVALLRILVNHLTNRSSQPLAVPMSSFSMTSTVNPAAKLASVSGD
jgi:TRAP-type C4-dicarboxylate transport system permease small subunit